MEQCEEDADLHEVEADSETCLARDVLEAIHGEYPDDDKHSEVSDIAEDHLPATDLPAGPLELRALPAHSNTSTLSPVMIERDLLLWDSNPVSRRTINTGLNN